MGFNFIISFLLTIPIVLYSFFGRKVLGIHLPVPLPVSLAFPDGGVNLLSLLFASLVVFLPRQALIFDRFFILKKIIFDRSFFVAIAILVIYFYSFVATVFVELKMEAFFEVVAILVTLVLLGQWMKNLILNFAIRQGVKHNILIKNEKAFKNASKINAIIIEKVGILTEGKLKVTDIFSYNGFSAEDVLRYEANVEVGSNHPLAKAILEESKKKGAMPSKPMEKFESFAGLGIKAQVNGKIILTGKEKLLEENSVDMSKGAEAINSLTEEGKTLSLLAVDGIFAGIIAVADTIKPTANRAISELKAMGIELVMITGDHIKVAESVGRELGIDKYYAGVLSQDKASYVKKLQDEGKFTAMVGDGINDALALAQANIGIAIMAGNDVLEETGNIILMKSDPLDIVTAIKLSKATVKKMKRCLPSLSPSML